MSAITTIDASSDWLSRAMSRRMVERIVGRVEADSSSHVPGCGGRERLRRRLQAGRDQAVQEVAQQHAVVVMVADPQLLARGVDALRRDRDWP